MQISSKQIMYFIIILTCVQGALIDDLHFPQLIVYLSDLACVFLLILFFNSEAHFERNLYYYLIVLLSLSALVGWIINGFSIFTAIWSIRNNYRFYLFFLLCGIWLELEDVDKIFSIFYKLQFLNLFFTLYQYLILGLRNDGVGGIFGNGNGPGLNVFQLCLVAYFLCEYVYHRCSLTKLAFVLTSSIFISALAEEKFFYVGIIIIGLVFLILQKFSVKKMVIVIVMIIALFLSARLLETYNSNSLSILTSFSDLMDYNEETMLHGGYVLGRFGSFSRINEIFFDNNPIKILFGFGLGNCEHSTISLFNSAFYNMYSSYHYFYFTHQTIYLEQGIVGFVLYLSIFSGAWIQSIYYYLSYMGDKYKRYALFLSMSVPVLIATIWYNASLKNKEAYVAFFVVAIIIILKRELMNEKDVLEYSEDTSNSIIN